MDDLTLIARVLPVGWGVEPYDSDSPDLWVISLPERAGFVTVDFKSRSFELGMCRPRKRRDDSTFMGRNWKVTMVQAAVRLLEGSA